MVLYYYHSMSVVIISNLHFHAVLVLLFLWGFYLSVCVVLGGVFCVCGFFFFWGGGGRGCVMFIILCGITSANGHFVY